MGALSQTLPDSVCERTNFSQSAPNKAAENISASDN
jgi:hypothetical protein